MKTQMLSTAFVAMALLCGCSSTKFTEYHVADVIQGAGGLSHEVDGIEFWDKGDPDRKYKILGVISESPKHRVPLGRLTRIFSDHGNNDDKDSAMAKVARKHGGNAIIFASKDGKQSDAVQTDDGNHKRFTLVVIKYVD
jgi:hypothetical protein